MGLYKKESGLIFDDKFDSLNARWIVSPSDSYILDSGLKLNHSSTGETIALFELPQEDKLLLEVTADYFPIIDGDSGGIVIWKSSLDRLDFLESKDLTKPFEYSVWRAGKENNNWMFYAKHGGVWEFCDSAVLNAAAAGVVLKGYPSTESKSLNVKRVVLCRGNNVKIENITEVNRVDLCLTDGSVVVSESVSSGDSGVEIVLPYIPFEGIIKVYLNEELDCQLDSVTIYGGDIYAVGSDLKIFWKGYELSTKDATYLGKMMNDMIEEKMQLVNTTPVTVTDVTLSIKKYREEIGYQMVDVALDNGGLPGTYGDILNFGTLEPGESRDFWVRLAKTVSDLFSFKPTHFILDILHN